MANRLPTLTVRGARAGERALEPFVALELTLSAPGGAASATLAITVRIEPRLAAIDEAQRALLSAVLGPEALASRALAGVLWTRASLAVPAFEDTAILVVPLPCALGLEHAVGKLLVALEGAPLPLTIDARGTVLVRAEGGIEARPLGPPRELTHALDGGLVRAALDESLGDRRLLALEASLRERLASYALRTGAPTEEAAVAQLLREAGA